MVVSANRGLINAALNSLPARYLAGPPRQAPPAPQNRRKRGKSPWDAADRL